MSHEMHPLEDAIHLGKAVTEKIDHVRKGAADTLENAASTVRSTAAHGTHAIDSFADGTADRLDGTAKRMRNLHPMCALQDALKRPGVVACCVGIGAGFLLGLSI